MKHPLLRCFGFYRNHIGLFVAVTLVLGLVNMSMPYSTMLFGMALHDVERGVAVVRTADGIDTSRAWFWVSVMVGLAVGRAVVHYLATVLSQLLGQRLLFHMRDLLLTQVQALDFAYHQQHGAGELISRTTRDSDKVRDALVNGLRSLIELAAAVIGSLYILCLYHPLLAAVPAALTVIAIAIVLGFAERLVTLDRETDSAYDAVTQDLSEGVHGVRVIKAFALEQQRIAQFSRHGAIFSGRVERALAFTTSRLTIPQLIVALGHAWVLWCGVDLVASGRMNVGELIAATMVMMGMVFRVESIGRVLQIFAEARSSAGRIMELVDARSPISDGSEKAPDGRLGLRMRGVRVEDSSGNMILADFDLDVTPGETVALVGATGSGKSTFASLLPRLRDAQAGSIAIGSDARGWHELRHLRLAELRRRVQVVFQDGFLFSDSLAANLRLADPAASDDELRAMLTLVSADDVLATLPDGLNSRIGERGVTLSGGQRQRVCLARALLAKPGLLCADDSTSALDAITERRILDNLRAGASTTLILIASKLSTILRADRVLLLDQGRIVAQGTHEELLRTSAAYRDLLGLENERTLGAVS
jgi:ATP-binding cassette, subfamily B, bacterial